MAAEARAEKAFTSAMLVTVADDEKKDRDYCVQMIDSSPPMGSPLGLSFSEGSLPEVRECLAG